MVGDIPSSVIYVQQENILGKDIMGRYKIWIIIQRKLSFLNDPLPQWNINISFRILLLQELQLEVISQRFGYKRCHNFTWIQMKNVEVKNGNLFWKSAYRNPARQSIKKITNVCAVLKLKQWHNESIKCVNCIYWIPLLSL